MDVINQFIEHYKKRISYYDMAARLGAQLLDEALRSSGIRAMVISRAKNPARLKVKVAKRAESLETPYQNLTEIYDDIADLAGIRVSLYFPGDRDKADRVINTLFSVSEIRRFPTESKPPSYNKRFSGYWANHYRVQMREDTLENTQKKYSRARLEIQVASEFVFYEHITDETEHEIVYQYNDELPAWQETVLQEGSDGEYREVYEVVYQDGEETARQLIEVTETEAVPTIIEKGTVSNFANNGDSVSSIVTNSDGSGSITLENGEVLTFSEARNMKGTAYTTGGKVGTITASGTTVHVGVVAVDKSVLPLGSKVYVVSNDGEYVYGFAVAEDTGVKGNTIDLYMDTYNECIQFGVRSCTVYVLD